MNTIRTITVIVLVFLATFISAKAQEVPVAALRIVSCDARLTGYTYSQAGVPVTAQSHSPGKRSGYVYEVTIRVGLLNGVESSKDPFAVICRLPDGKIKGVILNQDRTLIEGLVSNPFIFQIETADKGIATFEIGTLGPEVNTVIPNPDVPEDSKSEVFLE